MVGGVRGAPQHRIGTHVRLIVRRAIMNECNQILVDAEKRNHFVHAGHAERFHDGGGRGHDFEVGFHNHAMLIFSFPVAGQGQKEK